MCIKYNRVTKVRSRHADKPRAVQPVVIVTPPVAVMYYK